MATYTKTRELTVGPAGTALSVYHLTAHQNIDSEIQDISSALSGKILPTVSKRQGGSATDWNASGTTTYTPSAPVIQCGTGVTSGGEQSSGSFFYSTLTVTFPTAFVNKPIVLANAIEGNGYCKVDATNTGFTVTNWSPYTGGVDAQKISWIAIGE